MEIHEIVHLLYVIWNHEPCQLNSEGKHTRGSHLPEEINTMFWMVCERDEEHTFIDKWETEEQNKWSKQAWR